MPESVQSCFELSIHFPVFFPANYGLVAVHGWFAIEINVWIYSGLMNLKIITAIFIIGSLGFISFALQSRGCNSQKEVVGN